MSRFRKAIAAGLGAAGTGMVSVAATLTTTDSNLDAKTGVISILVIVGGGLATFGTTYGVTNDAY